MNGERFDSGGNQADDDVRRIAEDLKAYLDAHPEAADSLTGIVHWWLERQRAERQSRKIRRALEFLVDEGLVTREETPDGGVIYRARND